jgi:hypothetical protein
MRMQWSWLLVGAAIVGATESRAATVTELLEKARKSEEAGIKAGYVLQPLVPPAALHEPSADERAKGVVVFRAPLAQWFRGLPPSREEATNQWNVRLAKGETESWLFAAYGVEEKKGVLLQAKGVPADKDLKVEILPLVMAPLSLGKSLSGSGVMGDIQGTNVFMRPGLWLAENGPVDLPKGESRAWVVRATATARTPPGAIPLTLELSEGGKSLGTAAVELSVLPFQLVDLADRGYVNGVFYGSLPKTEGQFRQLKEHGIDAIQWFYNHDWGTVFKNDGGKLKMTFDELDARVAMMKKAGMKGPLIISQNGEVDSFYNQICKTMGRPKDNLDDPETMKFLVDGWRQIFTHAAEKGWPELVVVPNDEPTRKLHHDIRMARHRRTVKILRDNFPKVRIYGVCMEKLSAAKEISDVDIFVCNGEGEAIRKYAQETHKTAWYYSGGGAAAYGYDSTRFFNGLRVYAKEFTGKMFWSIGYYMDDPFNEFDGERPDSAWNMVWPPIQKGGDLVESISFEGTRAGANDIRYAMTLDALLEKRTDEKAEAIRAALRDLKMGDMRKQECIPAVREKLANWIVQMSEGKGGN